MVFFTDDDTSQNFHLRRNIAPRDKFHGIKVSLSADSQNRHGDAGVKCTLTALISAVKAHANFTNS